MLTDKIAYVTSLIITPIKVIKSTPLSLASSDKMPVLVTAQLVRQSTNNSEFDGSNPAALGSR